MGKALTKIRAQSAQKKVNEKIESTQNQVVSNQLPVSEEILNTQSPTVSSKVAISEEFLSTQSPTVSKSAAISEEFLSTQSPTVSKSVAISEEFLSTQSPTVSSDVVITEEILSSESPTISSGQTVVDEEDLSTQAPPISSNPPVSFEHWPSHVKLTDLQSTVIWLTYGHPNGHHNVYFEDYFFSIKTCIPRKRMVDPPYKTTQSSFIWWPTVKATYKHRTTFPGSDVHSEFYDPHPQLANLSSHKNRLSIYDPLHQGVWKLWLETMTPPPNQKGSGFSV